MPRGGRREGTPGKAYSNRTDLTSAVAPSQHYGDRVAREAQQKALPLAQRPDLAALTMPPQGMPTPSPGLFRESERPDEPVTSGLPLGPGAGPSMNFDLGTRDLLEAIARRFPNPDIARLLDNLDE